MSVEPPPYRVREYRLALDVDYETLAFQGTVEIDLTGVTGPVLLNSVGLTIHSARAGEKSLPVVAKPEEEGFLLEDVPGPDTTVTVEFTGAAAEPGLIGLYVSRYGAYRILTTQCAPTGARRVFPCVDRPDVKAPIALDLTVGIDDDVVFNTTVVEQRTKGDRKRLKFDPTPPMATYLFYLGIGPIEERRGRANQVRMKALTPLDRSESAAFALEQAGKLLPAYEEYFGIPYPLSKLDLVAIPEMSFGAMENWGAITFRDARLLVDERSSALHRRTVISTIAHELAHMWFGNLVTMSWWTDIWLNESFATLLEPKIVERIRPGDGTLDDFLLIQTAPSMFLDGLPGTHPVSSEVERPEQISEIFDEISYGKGASVLRMVEAFLGEEKFRAGVTEYIQRFRYGNARSADLWAELERGASRPLQPILDAWIARPGHPVIEARWEGEQLRLTQRRFSFEREEHDDPPWPIPISMELNGATTRLLFDSTTMELPVTSVTSLHLNPAGVGYYRVRYDATLLEGILGRFATLGPMDRWTLLSDAFAFLFSGELPVDRYLRFVTLSAGSIDDLPAIEVCRQFAGGLVPSWSYGLGYLLPTHAPTAAAFRSFLTAQWDRLGPAAREGERDTSRTLRGLVARCLVWNDTERSRELAQEFSRLPSVDPDVRPAVVLAYARNGAATEHEELVNRLRETEDEATMAEYENALTAFRPKELVASTLELIASDSVNQGHITTMLEHLAENPEGRDALWEWLQLRGLAVLAPYSGTGYAGSALESTLPYVALDREEEVAAYFSDHPWPESTRGLRKGLELARVASRFLRSVA